VRIPDRQKLASVRVGVPDVTFWERLWQDDGLGWDRLSDENVDGVCGKRIDRKYLDRLRLRPKTRINGGSRDPILFRVGKIRGMIMPMVHGAREDE